MRSLPSLTAHAVALILILSLSTFWTIQFQDKGVEAVKTSDTTDVLYGVVMGARDQRQSGQASLPAQLWHDQVAAWKSNDLRNLYQAQFESYLKSVYLTTGDAAHAYKMLAGPLNFIYLLGCYLLFLAVGGSWRLSLTFAVLASFPVFIPLAGESFGMGPFTYFSRRHLFTAFVPFVLFLFYQFRNDRRALPFVFAFIGVIANLHASGLLLVGIALIVYIFQSSPMRARLAYGILLLLIACTTGFIALGSVWKVIGDFAGKSVGLLLSSAQAASADSRVGIPAELQYLFYPPHIYSHLPETLVHAMSAAVFCIAVMPLILRGRVSKGTYGNLLFASAIGILAFLGFSELKLWLCVALLVWLSARSREPTPFIELTSLFILATYLVSFVLAVVFQFAYLHVADFPLLYNNLRGVRFLGLFVFVWLVALACQIGPNIQNRSVKIVIVLLFALAAFSEVRQLVRDNFRRPANQNETASLMQVARWAKGNTSLDARFFVAGSAFGIVAERRVYLTDKQSYNCPTCRRLTLGTDKESTLRAARENGMDYAVLKKDERVIAAGEAIYQNDHFMVLRVEPHQVKI